MKDEGSKGEEDQCVQRPRGLKGQEVVLRLEDSVLAVRKVLKDYVKQESLVLIRKDLLCLLKNPHFLL